MSFIDILDTLIAKKRITKTQFLRDLGYSKNAYSEWKNGITKSYLSKIDDIATYFEVSVDYLLGRETPPRKLDDVDEILQQLHDRPENKIMFKSTAKATKEDILKAAEYLDYLTSLNRKEGAEDENQDIYGDD